MSEQGNDEQRLIGFDLGAISVQALNLLLADENDEAFYEELLASNRSRVEILAILRLHPRTPDRIRGEASEAMSLPVPKATELEAIREEYEAEEVRPERERTQTVFQQLKNMSVAERIYMAMRGNQEVRSILLKDNSKEVVRMVMQNPKLTESEVEILTKNRNTSDDILRIISKNREWMKNYSVLHGLVSNPKTPPGISSRLVSRLAKSDLKTLSVSRNVPEIVRSAAKRALAPKKRRE